MILIIAEKPSVGKSIGEVLNVGKLGDGFIYNNECTITWAYGHLVGLVSAKAYGFDSWNLEDLPIIPDPFKLCVNENKGSQKQFNVVKKLLLSCDELIVATDAGREGELIFRYIYEFSGCQKPFMRLWISSLTKVSIENGFKNLQPGTNFDNLYFAAKCRNQADWMVGINGTVAFTVSSKSSGVLSLGRVQTPVFAMVCKRFIENRDFKSVAYFVPELILEKDATKFKSVVYDTENRIFNKPDAAAIIEDVGNTVVCTSVDQKSRIEKQPLLYDLTSLQIIANKRYGFVAKKTLDIAQSLYEKKWITYPRTDSRYLTEDMYAVMPLFFSRIQKNFYFSSYRMYIEKLSDTLPTRCINDKKVVDHHAIIPTGDTTGELNEDEKCIFDLIVRRTIESFLDVCKKEIITYVFNKIFKSSGVTIVVAGWRIIELDLEVKDREKSNNVKEDAEDEEKEIIQLLPNIVVDENTNVVDRSVVNKETKPKPFHSEGSLLRLMETASIEIKDEELANAIKNSGIGTPATRASIIEKLIGVGYMIRDKKHLLPTVLGLNIYGQIKDLAIANPELTGSWENKLNQMAKGAYAPEEFNKEIKDFTIKLLPELIECAKNVETQSIKAICPRCKEGNIIESKLTFGCDRYKSGCDFSIWKICHTKKLSVEIIEALIRTGEYNKVVKGFRINGNSCEGMLRLNEDFKLRIVFERKSLGFKCPKCNNGEIVLKKAFYGCNDYKNGCDFKIWLNISGKEITPEIVKMLIEKQKLINWVGLKLEMVNHIVLH